MKKSILAVVTALSMSGAWAQVYMGAGLTTTNTSINCTGMNTCSTNDGGAKVYGGYVTKSGVGFELQYMQIGDATASNGTLNVNYESSAIAAAAVLRGTISKNFWVHTKLGLARVKTTGTSRTSTTIFPQTSESVTKPYVSVGAEFGFVENVKLSAFIDMTKGKVNGDSVGMRMAGLGVEFLF